MDWNFFPAAAIGAIAASAGWLIGDRKRVRESKRRDELLFNAMLALRAMAGRMIKVRKALDLQYNAPMTDPVRETIANVFTEAGRAVSDAREALGAIERDAPFDPVKRIVIEYSSGLQYQYAPEVEASAAKKRRELDTEIEREIEQGSELTNPLFPRKATDA